MNRDTLTVNEVEKLTGVTVRALHYYDEIGLLPPRKNSENRYRQYTDADLQRLQEILFLRELDIPLKEIKRLLDSPDYDREEAFRLQKRLLTLKKARLEKIIELLDGQTHNMNETSFGVFSMNEIQEEIKMYKKEVIEKWGNTKEYKQFEKLDSQLTERERQDKQQMLNDKAKDVFTRLQAQREKGAVASEAQALASEWQKFLNDNYYDCSDEMLLNLAQMYVCDERFTTFIDGFGEKGLAEYFLEVVKAR